MNSMSTFTTTIERESEMAVTVAYNYFRGCRGARDSLCGVRGAGPPLEPDEPPSVEIISVKGTDGADYIDDLTDIERDSIEKEALNDAAEIIQNAKDEAAERRYENTSPRLPRPRNSDKDDDHDVRLFFNEEGNWIQSVEAAPGLDGLEPIGQEEEK